jgi:hypothetical protein
MASVDFTKPVFTRQGRQLEIVSHLPSGGAVVRWPGEPGKARVAILESDGQLAGKQVAMNNWDETAKSRQSRFTPTTIRPGTEVFYFHFSRVNSSIKRAIYLRDSERKNYCRLSTTTGEVTRLRRAVFGSREEVTEWVSRLISFAGER